MRKTPTKITQTMYKSGTILKNRRESLGISIQNASLETKIKEEYLMRIEQNRYTDFDSDVFVSGYIKIYASYLGLDVDKILAIFRRDNPNSISNVKSKAPKLLSESPFERIKSYITPKFVTALLLLIAVSSIFGYLIVQFWQFQNPPSLVIATPDDQITVNEDKIMIQGSTDQDTRIRINQDEIGVSVDGDFERELFLVEGANIINVEAIKRNNSNAIASTVLTIIYEPLEASTSDEEEAVETPSEEEIDEFKFEVSIVGAESWTLVNVDDQQAVAGILPDGYLKEFIVTKNFYINSGRPTNTFIKINGVEQDLRIDRVTGTAQLACEIDGNKFECE